jgi:hypothetical protein
MWDRFRDFWVPRLLFLVTLGLALLLAAVVLLAPWLAERNGSRLLATFAADAVVRRTTLASAAGLAVTAFVFFRPGGFGFLKKKDKNRVPPPMAGA